MRGATRQHIIQIASMLFYKNGYNTTGINEIIAKAGIAKATLYAHFPSKEDLCIAYLRHRNSFFLEEIEPFCAKEKKGAKQVLAIFDFLSSFYATPEFNGCWCIKTVAEIPQSKGRIKTEIQTQKKAFLDFIEKLLNDNLGKKKRNKGLSKQIYLLYEGAVAESHLHGESWPIIEAKGIAKILLNK